MGGGGGGSPSVMAMNRGMPSSLAAAAAAAVLLQAGSLQQMTWVTSATVAAVVEGNLTSPRDLGVGVPVSDRELLTDWP